MSIGVLNKFRGCVLPGLIVSASLSVYYYVVSSSFRTVFLNDSAGPLLIWRLRSPLQPDILVVFASSLIIFSALCAVFKTRGISPRAFYVLCVPSLMVFVFLPQTALFPEFIPLAAVVLPAASVSALVSILITRSGSLSRRTAAPAGSARGPFRRLFLVWMISFLVFAASGLNVNETTGYHRGDEGHYFTIARSIAEDFDIDIIPQIPGYRPSWQRRVHIAAVSPEGHGYSWHPPGLSFVFAPFFRMFEDHRAQERAALFSLYAIGAFLAVQIYLAAADASGSAKIASFVWIVLSFSSPLWLYTVRAYSMMPGGLCLLYCWRRLKYMQSGKKYQAVIFNLLLAWLAWLHGSFLAGYAVLGLILFVFWLKNPRSRVLYASLIVQAVNVGLFFFFHHRWFGSDLMAWGGSSAAPEGLARVGGWLVRFWPGMFAMWLDFFRGMAIASPVNFLGFVLLFFYVFRKKDVYGFLLLLIFLSVYVPTSATPFWAAGTCHPGRRLSTVVPLWAPAVAYFMRHKKTPSFYWAAIFSGIISIGYMSYFMTLEPFGFTRPLSHIATAEQIFRPLNFHLPNFGRYFHPGFPWGHVCFAIANAALFVLFWALIVKKDRGVKNGCMFAGMALTVAWVFVSVGFMKHNFDTTSIIPHNTERNFRRDTVRIAEPEKDCGLFVYSLPPGDVFKGSSSYSHIQEGLPHYLDISRGLYEVEISGSAPPFARGEAEVFYIRHYHRLVARFPVAAGADGMFEAKNFLYMPRDGSEAVNIFVEGDEDFTVEKTVITPVPLWLESLSDYIAGTGKHHGLFRHRQKEFADVFSRVPPEGFRLVSASHAEESLGNMLDENPGTRWAPPKAQEPGMYFEVDMGREYTVSGIRLDQGDFWKDWPRGLLIHASVDGENWEKVYDDSDSMAGYVYDDRHDVCFRNMENCVRALFGPAEARWLKVEQTGSEETFWWSVAGFSVLAPTE